MIKSAFHQAADLLLESINKNQFKGALPSARALAKTYKVSPPTMLKALAFLTEQGVLHSEGGSRKCFTAQPLPLSTTGPREEAPRVLCVLGCRADQLPPQVLASLYDVSQALAQEGGKWVQLESKALSTAPALKNAIKSVRPSHLIFERTTRDALQPFRRFRIPIMIMGPSSPGIRRVHRVGVSLGRLEQEALKRLAGLGYRSIHLVDATGRPRNDRPLRGDARSHGVGLGITMAKVSPSDGRILDIDAVRLGIGRQPAADCLVFQQWDDMADILPSMMQDRMALNGKKLVVLIRQEDHRWEGKRVAGFDLASGFYTQAILNWLRKKESALEPYERMFSTWSNGD